MTVKSASYECDHCGRSIDRTIGPLHVVVWDDLHVCWWQEFCSYECLSLWAQRRADTVRVGVRTP